jgi:hypothetical protein
MIDTHIDVAHLQQLRERLIRDCGEMALLALFERDDNQGRWDLIVAGGGLSDARLDDFRVVADAMKDTLTLEERREIPRIVILPDDYEPVVKLVRRVQPVNGAGPVELENINFYQFLIRTALIFHADPTAVGTVHA